MNDPINPQATACSVAELNMLHKSYKMMLVVSAIHIAIAVLSLFMACLVLLVIEHGLHQVLSESLYPVSLKPTITISNGEVWSESRTFLSFLLSCALWASMMSLVLKALGVTKNPQRK